MLRRSYLFESLCKRAQNRACSSSAECSQDYLKTMQEGRRSSPLGPHKAERKCLVEELLQPKQPVFSWLKFLCEALGKVESQDQAACIFDALAWSFEQNRVSDPLCIFDAQGCKRTFSKSVNRCDYLDVLDNLEKISPIA